MISIPNLAHLNSRFYFFLRGALDRTDNEIDHPGERPMRENIRLLQEAGFGIIKKKGITLTVPILYKRIICRKPSLFKFLHDAFEPIAIPPLAMINIFLCENDKK